MSSVKTPGSLSMRHHSPALPVMAPAARRPRHPLPPATDLRKPAAEHVNLTSPAYFPTASGRRPPAARHRAGGRSSHQSRSKTPPRPRSTRSSCGRGGVLSGKGGASGCSRRRHPGPSPVGGEGGPRRKGRGSLAGTEPGGPGRGVSAVGSSSSRFPALRRAPSGGAAGRRAGSQAQVRELRAAGWGPLCGPSGSGGSRGLVGPPCLSASPWPRPSRHFAGQSCSPSPGRRRWRLQSPQGRRREAPDPSCRGLYAERRCPGPGVRGEGSLRGRGGASTLEGMARERGMAGMWKGTMPRRPKNVPVQKRSPRLRD